MGYWPPYASQALANYLEYRDTTSGSYRSWVLNSQYNIVMPTGLLPFSGSPSILYNPLNITNIYESDFNYVIYYSTGYTSNYENIAIYWGQSFFGQPNGWLDSFGNWQKNSINGLVRPEIHRWSAGPNTPAQQYSTDISSFGNLKNKMLVTRLSTSYTANGYVSGSIPDVRQIRFYINVRGQAVGPFIRVAPPGITLIFHDAFIFASYQMYDEDFYATSPVYKIFEYSSSFQTSNTITYYYADLIDESQEAEITINEIEVGYSKYSLQYRYCNPTPDPPRIEPYTIQYSTTRSILLPAWSMPAKGANLLTNTYYQPNYFTITSPAVDSTIVTNSSGVGTVNLQFSCTNPTSTYTLYYSCPTGSTSSSVTFSGTNASVSITVPEAVEGTLTKIAFRIKNANGYFSDVRYCYVVKSASVTEPPSIDTSYPSRKVQRVYLDSSGNETSRTTITIPNTSDSSLYLPVTNPNDPPSMAGYAVHTSNKEKLIWVNSEGKYKGQSIVKSMSDYIDGLGGMEIIFYKSFIDQIVELVEADHWVTNGDYREPYIHMYAQENQYGGYTIVYETAYVKMYTLGEQNKPYSFKGKALRLYVYWSYYPYYTQEKFVMELRYNGGSIDISPANFPYHNIAVEFYENMVIVYSDDVSGQYHYKIYNISSSTFTNLIVYIRNEDLEVVMFIRKLLIYEHNQPVTPLLYLDALNVQLSSPAPLNVAYPLLPEWRVIPPYSPQSFTVYSPAKWETKYELQSTFEVTFNFGTTLSPNYTLKLSKLLNGSVIQTTNYSLGTSTSIKLTLQVPDTVGAKYEYQWQVLASNGRSEVFSFYVVRIDSPAAFDIGGPANYTSSGGSYTATGIAKVDYSLVDVGTQMLKPGDTIEFDADYVFTSTPSLTAKTQMVNNMPQTTLKNTAGNEQMASFMAFIPFKANEYIEIDTSKKSDAVNNGIMPELSNKNVSAPDVASVPGTNRTDKAIVDIDTMELKPKDSIIFDADYVFTSVPNVVSKTQLKGQYLQTTAVNNTGVSQNVSFMAFIPFNDGAVGDISSASVTNDSEEEAIIEHQSKLPAQAVPVTNTDVPEGGNNNLKYIDKAFVDIDTVMLKPGQQMVFDANYVFAEGASSTIEAKEDKLQTTIKNTSAENKQVSFMAFIPYKDSKTGS